MPNDSLAAGRPLSQSTAAILSEAVEVASKHLRECQRAIEEDQHARARLAEEFARIAARRKPAPDWKPEELEAAARPRPIEGRPQKPRGLLGVMPLAWRDSCARLAEQLEGAGYAFQAGEVRRLLSSVPRQRPLSPEDVVPDRDATAAVVKVLLELLGPLAKDLQRFEGVAEEAPLMASEGVYPSAKRLCAIGWAAGQLAAALEGRHGQRDLAAVFKADELLWRLVAEVEPADPLEGVPHADKLRKQQANFARALGLEPQAPRPRTAKTLLGWPPSVNEALAHVRRVAVRVHQAILAFDPDDPAKQWSWPGLDEARRFAQSAGVLSSAGYKAKGPAATKPATAAAVAESEGNDADDPEWRRNALATMGEPPERGSPPPAPGAEGEGARPKATVRKPKPSEEKAYGQWKTAVEANAELDGATDRAVFDWVNENMLDEGETLPTFATWTRQLRTARRYRGERKNEPRAERPHGKTVVRQNQL